MRVPVYPVHVKLLQFAVAVIVAVPDELASRYTLFDDVGTVAPTNPPDVYDHCVVVEASQLAVPPTQYRVPGSVIGV